MTPYLQHRTNSAPRIQSKPSLNLGLVVVIPVHDEPHLLLSLMALNKCIRPTCDVEVIVVVNSSEKDPAELKERNQATVEQAELWASKNKKHGIRFHTLHIPGMNAKHAGVGYARKIGMDEATWRLEKVKNPKGIIACFDADCRCEEDYFLSIVQHFEQYPKAKACSIYFEHPIVGADFEDAIYASIIDYELHLRYYIQAQRFAGFPMAFHTVGSSMAVRCDAYQKQGGMNKRKAGEDFYFIHKFTGLGHFMEITATCVIPSPRPSNRVPFGTGKAIQAILKEKGNYLTYAPQSFEDLKLLFDAVSSFFREENLNLGALPKSIQEFLLQQGVREKIKEIKQNTAGEESFKKRFYQWFDAFLLMKYVHFARDQYYPNVLIGEAAAYLLRKLRINPSSDNKSLLLQYRKLDRERTF